jgi:predicted exporter
MIARKAWVIAAWLCAIALAAAVAVHARYITDLSAFLPSKPTPMQRLLVDQLRAGPASRLILVALEGGDITVRARASSAMARVLRKDREFSSVNNGEDVTADRDREFLFQHRYLLSSGVTPQHFSAAGLKSALEETVANLASPEGLILGSLVTRDPTGETLRIIDQLARTPAPQTRDGVWVSPDGTRALLVAVTAAAGSDTDAQEHALQAIRAAFAASGAESLRLSMSGPGVFAVASRANIEHAVVRLSIAGSSLVIMMLLLVYRSVPALILGLLPVASGALIGVAAVALGFGAVHGITLGFGVTLIGESVDYSIYFFIQSRSAAPDGSGAHAWRRRLWPTLRLGMLTSVCGFASLLPSAFPGLAQLGAYSISGLVAAAAVTRFLLPELLPGRLAIRDLMPVGTRIASRLKPLRRLSVATLWGPALAAAAIALVILYVARDRLWNRELSSLSPVPAAEQRYDAALRSDLGAPNVLDLVVVSGDSLESVLRGAERAARTLEPLIGEKVIAAFDNPATYLPSLATQAERRASLPDRKTLHANLGQAAAGLALDSGQLTPFLEDVEAARQAPLIAPADLEGTSLAAGYDALILHQPDRWNALLPLHAVNAAEPDIDVARVRAALAAAPSSDTQLLDLKQQSDALYAGYLYEALRLSLAGFAAIVALLLLALRSVPRVARVLAPLILAVLVVAAGLVLCRQELTILHLVGMLLIVAVGSNYALFFDRHRHGDGDGDGDGAAPLTLVSLGVANLCTVIGFGLLSFSGVPVLEALGSTVAPGTLLALLFAAALTPPRAERPAGA